MEGLPSFANNRFGIKQELAFYLIVAWRCTMTYVSNVRLFDPDAQTNKLLTSTFSLNHVVYEAFVLALAVQFTSINGLMRYVWNVPGLCSIHESDSPSYLCTLTSRILIVSSLSTVDAHFKFGLQNLRANLHTLFLLCLVVNAPLVKTI